MSSSSSSGRRGSSRERERSWRPPSMRSGCSPAGRVCLDIGASTGGFTDCLLQGGAARVIALDVGYGQLHPRLRDDPRVIVMERTNARHLTALPFAPELVVCDASFIAAAKVVEPALRLAARGLGGTRPRQAAVRGGARRRARRGSSATPRCRNEWSRTFCLQAATWGAAVAGVVDSGLPGPKGNREFVVHLRAAEEATDPDDIRRLVVAAVAG